MMIKKIQFLFILLLSFFIASTSLALETEWGLQYSLNPEHPQPGDTVILKLKSYSMDLNRSDISYFINDKFKENGIGLKNFIFSIPKNNQKVKINIIAKGFDEKVEKKEFSIQPTSVDLTYEVIDPYRPNFYKGKSIPLSNSKVEVFAFPNFVNDFGKKLNPKTLIYSWKVNEKFVKGGMGKDSLVIKKLDAFPRKTKIQVRVKSLDKRLLAYKTLILTPGISNIDFYIDDKIYPFNFKSVAKPNLTEYQKNNNIVAIPYFFNDINLSDIQWYINGTLINILSNEDPLIMNIIRNKENVVIPLKIRLKIENNGRILQSVDSNITSKSSQNLIDEFQERVKKMFKEENIQKENNFFGN